QMNTIQRATVVGHGAAKERKLQFGTVFYFDDMIAEVDGQRRKVSGSAKTADPAGNYPLNVRKYYRWEESERGIKIAPAKKAEIDAARAAAPTPTPAQASQPQTQEL